MSNEEFELNCEVRSDLGKGASRRLRRLNDSIPAVLYGGGKDAVSLTIAHKDIAKATENEAFAPLTTVAATGSDVISGIGRSSVSPATELVTLPPSSEIMT